MAKRKPSKDLTHETHTSSEVTTRESSYRPSNKVRRVVGNVKDGTEDGVYNLRTSRSRDSRSSSPVPPNVYHECTSSISNLEVQATPFDVEMEDDTQSTLQDAQESAKRMHPLTGPAINYQDAQADLNTVGMFQDTYLKPLRMFNEVIGKIVDVCRSSSRLERN
ncbi:hypothetical protein BDR07DRAFT_684513 [Suillus spraguei]|nr:hypothetical protein BDR07DRAFT_684513 [Suillus spraguei]